MTAELVAPMPVYASPYASSGTTLADHREALARRAAWRLEDAPPEIVIRWAARTFGHRFAVTSSLADAVLIDLVARAAPGTDLIFLDTGYHFPETLGMRDAVEATYRGRINVVTVTPDQTVAEQDAALGARLFSRDPDTCCFLRKVVPLGRALDGYDAWASGLRRDESPARAITPVVDWDARNQRVKLNPLARWTQADVDDYISSHDILLNTLVQDGFRSIGCAPCTRRVAPGEDDRAGRWSGTSKTECGLHLVGGPA
ncbi:MAG: phosphoadenosine phosphosulfate reductase [Actinomycetota bacterium]|nr:phosphoadenosine phosphosulfate reductase [Actinomycetota bacterium]